MYEIRRLLVPVDFSACARTALEHAIALAQRVGATIDVLHVWEPPHYVGPEFLIREPGETGHPLREYALAQAKKEMDQFLSGFRERDELRLRFESGKPHQTIIKLAADEHYDAIVMGTHGRTGLPHLVIGSVAEKVVRTAPCPVMTIRQPEASIAANERDELT
ncbi:MAG TPA: universal stress protein [Anaeromyxobacteraceae bacterium]